MTTTYRSEPHDPIVKGKGAECYAACFQCMSKRAPIVGRLLAIGSRPHVNRAVQRHRKETKRR